MLNSDHIFAPNVDDLTLESGVAAAVGHNGMYPSGTGEEEAGVLPIESDPTDTGNPF